MIKKGKPMTLMQDVPGNWNQAYLEALRTFREYGDPNRMAENSGICYRGDGDNGLFSLRYCGDHYEISYPKGDIRQVSLTGEVPASFQICLFLYMTQAVPVPERDEWRTFKDLPQGYHHWSPFIYEALDPLVKGFGEDLEAFEVAAVKLGGRPIIMGDMGYHFQVLPRIGLQVILWTGDEEFPPKSNILFNGAAVMQVDTATLYMIGIDLVRRLLYRAGKLAI